MFFFVWFLIPETKGMSLEAMDTLFGVTEMVKNMEADREARATSISDGKGEIKEVRKEIVA
jgi:hypothetical protein